LAHTSRVKLEVNLEPFPRASLHEIAAPRQVGEPALTVARIARELRHDAEPRQALDATLRELLSLFGARTVLFVARDQSNGRLYRRDMLSVDQEPTISDAELAPADELTYLFPTPAEAWYAVERPKAGRDRFDVVGLDPAERRPRKAAVRFPARFLAAHPFRSLLVLCAEGDGTCVNRLLLFDARVGARELRFLQTIAREIGPAIYNVELLGRLRTRVGAAERARLARDLHDGIIQSLIGLEMQVDVWRREAAADPPAASKLGHIQNALRAEVLELRDLIQRVKPVSIDPRHVLDHLASLVERFQRDSGITAHFVSEIDDLTLSPQFCEDVVRIVQEALVNVRKHSGARHVIVRVSATDSEWKFEVDDDGRGFEFAGRRSQAELDLERKGPVVIKERVRSIGGRLTVQSDPGQGARVEVRLPRRTHG
jgi:signal transduction histidine kinase